MKIDGVDITVEGLNDVTPEEIKHYLDYAQANTSGILLSLVIKPDEKDEDKVKLEWATQQKFERIRRITGKPTK